MGIEHLLLWMMLTFGPGSWEAWVDGEMIAVVELSEDGVVVKLNKGEKA